MDTGKIQLFMYLVETENDFKNINCGFNFFKYFKIRKIMKNIDFIKLKLSKNEELSLLDKQYIEDLMLILHKFT